MPMDLRHDPRVQRIRKRYGEENEPWRLTRLVIASIVEAGGEPDWRRVRDHLARNRIELTPAQLAEWHRGHEDIVGLCRGAGLIPP
jgi:hypothetical protein